MKTPIRLPFKPINRFLATLSVIGVLVAAFPAQAHDEWQREGYRHEEYRHHHGWPGYGWGRPVYVEPGYGPPPRPVYMADPRYGYWPPPQPGVTIVIPLR